MATNVEIRSISDQKKRGRLLRSSSLSVGRLAVAVVGFFLYFLWTAHSVLNRIESSATKLSLRVPYPSSVVKNAPRPPSSLNQKQKPLRFIIFRGILGGQGAGNIMNGLLAAHLLGLEFDRIVCIDPRPLKEFLAVFEPIHPAVLRHCPVALNEAALPMTEGDDISHRTTKDTIPKKGSKHLGRKVRHITRVSLVTYQPPPDECKLQHQLASDEKYILLTSNTYPRWPMIPPNFFFTYYKAKPILLDALPYDRATPPETVVHLRLHDGLQDKRKGLDQNTLDALGKALPPDTYLVTNRVAWYDHFEKVYGWRHPHWASVTHSAGIRTDGWGISYNNTKETENLHLFVDWYAILTAQTVYHTHSDFSLSAIHFQDIQDSKTILGTKEDGSLLLTDESWRVDGETERLVDRSLDAQGTKKLRLCRPKTTEMS
jgi:hypothetical protein